ncbi:MAG: UDP-N-acetylmuramyl-tripeptide synthetase [Patescibacteria group bacterium]|jgi:UDP-N-acetylmuramoyl-L-alanyl-D-glutamate--2,6-diaminopimelate ligase
MDKILSKVKKLIPKKIFKALQPAYHFLLGWISSLVYGRSSEKLIVIGVTGTTGKTTCVYLIAKVLESAGYKVGYTSTAMFSDGKKEWLNDKKMTMVGRFFTQKILKEMVQNGCQYAIVETTSEGITQFRHRFINYDIILYTGLYPEHIESHGSFENYRDAKGKLFSHLQKCRTKYCDENKKVIRGLSSLKRIELNRVKKAIIVNGDDEQAGYFIKFWAEEKFILINGKRQPERPPARQNRSGGELSERAGKAANKKFDPATEVILLEGVKAGAQGVSFKVSGKNIDLKLLGGFNAINASLAACFGISQGIAMERIKSGLEEISGIPGRLEKIDEGQPFTVIVDYAFEPKAVLKLYELVKMIPHKKIIHVLGSAGGGRDETRRPKLGEIAARNADVVIVTNEDPYDDDPGVIIDQVSLGAENNGKTLNENLFKVLDRRMAIKKALRSAGHGDAVLITGKGSEQAICAANGEKIPWDDREVVSEELKLIQDMKGPRAPSAAG